MNRFFKSAMMSIAVAATVSAPLADASAGERIRRDRHPVISHHGPNNGGELLAAGILGLAIGAIIVGAANNGQPVVEPRPRPHWDAFPDAPRHEPRVISYDDGYGYTPEPWSRDWFEACDARYRTFDPRTGTYVAKGGKRRFCTLN